MRKTILSFAATMLLFFASGSFANLFNVINDVIIPDQQHEISREAKTITSGEYIKPNEKHPNVFAPALRDRKGTLISVGTFRTLVGFSLGQFDRLIMFDVAQPILDFNREHLSFIIALTEKIKDVKTQRDEYHKKYSEYLNEYAKSDIAYYWQDDDKWRKITTALENGSINVISGDFEKYQNNKLFYSALKKNMTPLTLDISNVKQYVDGKLLAATLNKFAGISKGPSSMLITTFGFCYTQWTCLAESDWSYEFFPNMKVYIGYLEKGDFPITEHLDLEEWQIPFTMEKMAKYIEKNIINKNMHASPQEIREAEKEAKLSELSDSSQMRIFLEFGKKYLTPISDHLEITTNSTTLSANLDKLAETNVEYLFYNKHLKEGYGRYVGAGKLVGTFMKADLSGLDLSNQNALGNFSHALLAAANLNEAKLRGANFSDAILTAANLSSAIIWDADFSGAQMMGVNLTNIRGKAKIDHRTNLSGAYHVINGRPVLVNLEWLKDKFEFTKAPYIDHWKPTL